MDFQTSGLLYGSASTDNWVSGRSDLDLLLIVPEEKLRLLEKQIKIWKSKSEFPVIDGYVLYSSGNVIMAKELYKLESPPYFADTFIPLIDLWNIKNHSQHLFGQEVKAFIREINQEELKKWALSDIKSYWIPLLNSLVSYSKIPLEDKIPLSGLIWVASGVARMLMLSEGNICTSKRVALQWLAAEYGEIRNLVNLLIEEFNNPDNIARTLTAREALVLNDFYLRLFRQM